MAKQLRRARPGEIISAARFNELVDALNTVLSITAAFPLEVHSHTGGIHLALAVHEREAYVQLTGSLSSGGSATGKIKHLVGSSWVDAAVPEIRVYDVIGGMEGTSGQGALVRFHRQSGRWLVWQLHC